MTNVNLLSHRVLPHKVLPRGKIVMSKINLLPPGKLKHKGLVNNPVTTFAKNLLTEDICTRIRYTTKFILGLQLSYSAFSGLYSFMKYIYICQVHRYKPSDPFGCIYSNLIETIQRSLFLDNIFPSFINDSKGINNLDAYVFFGFGLPSLLTSFRNNYRAKLGDIIEVKSSCYKETEHIIKYRPTVKEKIDTTMTIFGDIIPKYLPFIYTSVLLFKTDVISLYSILVNSKMASAQNAITAMQHSFVIICPILFLYGLYHGLKISLNMFKK